MKPVGKQLKIAFLLNEFPCISETFILNQITGLLGLGHDVRIFAYRPAENAKDHEAVSKWDLLNKTKYFPVVPRAGRWRRFKRLLGILFRHSLRQPMRIWKCLDFQKYGFYESLNHLFLLEPLLNEDFDVIHCQYGTIGKEWAFLKDVMQVSLVTSFRGYDLTAFVRQNHSAIYEELFEKGDSFLPVCDYFAKKLEALGCPKDRICVHFSGVDINKFPLRDQQMDAKEIRIFSVGRLVEKKGFKYSIEGVAKLARRYPGVQYTIVGEGPLRPELEDLIHKLGMENHIHLVGSLPLEEVIKLLNKAHIFILTSVTAESGDQEGIPVSLQEAMATGLPVISTRHSGIPELIEDGKSGFLVDERDVDGIVSKCEYLISHPLAGAEMGRMARRVIEETVEISRLNQRLVKIYLKSLNGSFSK